MGYNLLLKQIDCFLYSLDGLLLKGKVFYSCITSHDQENIHYFLLLHETKKKNAWHGTQTLPPKCTCNNLKTFISNKSFCPNWIHVILPQNLIKIHLNVIIQHFIKTKAFCWNTKPSPAIRNRAFFTLQKNDCHLLPFNCSLYILRYEAIKDRHFICLMKFTNVKPSLVFPPVGNIFWLWVSEGEGKQQ